MGLPENKFLRKAGIIMGKTDTDGKNTKRNRIKFYVEKDSFCVKAAVVCLILSAIFRLTGCWGLWNDGVFVSLQIILPIICCLLYILCIMLLGKKLLSASLIPVVLGTVFFIARASDMVLWKMMLLIIVYIGAAVLYTATVLGYVHTKLPLAAVFAVPFIVHLILDFMRLGDTASPVTLHDGLQEISVLCILLALFFSTAAMKKQKPAIEEMDLPKMKAPRVIKPEKNKESGSAAAEEKRDVQPDAQHRQKSKKTAEEQPAAAETAENRASDKCGQEKRKTGTEEALDGPAVKKTEKSGETEAGDL